MKLKILFIDLNEGKKVGEPNFGILNISHHLKEHMDFVNISFEDSVNSFLKKDHNSFDVICFSVRSLKLKRLYNNDDFIKKLSSINCLKIIGGPASTVNPQNTLLYFDISVIGEGENTLLEIFKSIRKQKLKKEETVKFLNSNEIHSINNIYYKKQNSEVVKNKTDLKNNTDIIIRQTIDWSLIDIEEYSKNWPYLDYKNKKRGISLISSRSCPFNCSFCQPTVKKIFGKKVKYKEVDDIISDIVFLNKNHSINSFMLHDDVFTLDKKRVIRFSKKLIGLKKKGLSFNWICNARIDQIDEQMLGYLESSGCSEIRFGIETLDENIRNTLLNKNISDKKIKKTLKLMKDSKIISFGFFLVGLPNRTFIESLREVISISKTDLGLASFSILTPLPGTHIGNKYEVKSFESYYHSNRNNLSRMSLLQLEMLKVIANLVFYFNPKRLKRTLKQILDIKTLLYKLKRLI